MHGRDAAFGQAVYDLQCRPFDVLYDDAAHDRILLPVDFRVFQLDTGPRDRKAKLWSRD
ncbi:hypothetical protein GCM10011494_28070 [Novosphingobium endophyticum]|uniref:Uncharacterized protein n=1 Tax=Novosphingobium endophyticum TaxID=1955250 RepID=A0A916TU83_9SPHN|nr:hypothetical protein GCM10011494_28070 [Novosphingobium endophyticum]